MTDRLDVPDDPGAALPTTAVAEPLPRRRVLRVLAAMGVGTAVFQRALAAQVRGNRRVSADMVRQAEWVAGLRLSDEDRASTARGLNRAVAAFDAMRGVPLENSVPPALHFTAQPASTPSSAKVTPVAATKLATVAKRPASFDELAFLPVTQLAALLRGGEVTSIELTKGYLARLRRYDPVLRCLVTATEEVALKQAEQADRELAAGRDRGMLHGIPWGAKDLIAYPGYPTTWGATPFRQQRLEVKATVARRLEEAGAVLIGKLSLGALAMGDRWFRGMTRNPWDPRQGSSGSSAGPASATAAGLVGFSLGSETLGSIVSPCRRCGTSGLRPTFGRVSRYGCMTLAWSMDKIGPIARSIEDCAAVFAAICGRDGLDATVVDRPFKWPAVRKLEDLRVGYFEADRPAAERRAVTVLRGLGITMVPIRLPDKYPVGPLRIILDVEAGTAFDEITRRGITEGLNRWPATFRQAQFVPAVEYLRANRIRTLLMQEMEKTMADVDCYVGGDDLTLTNLTGHPTAVVPGGFTRDGDVLRPAAVTFTGRLFGESELLMVASAYQQATGHNLRHPPMERVTEENAAG